jgi:uncharacterized iron-regulated protein
MAVMLVFRLLQYRRTASICACSLGLLLLWTPPLLAQSASPAIPAAMEARIVSLRSQTPYDPHQLLPILAKADVVYLGETHDRAADHKAQLAIIQALHRLHPRLVIGMEMFQRPYQSVLNRYMVGELDEAQLQTLTQYQRRWGFPWEFYAPILRFAREQQRPVIALNVPSEVTRRVARSGLSSLTLAERRFIPPLSAIVLEPDSYREELRRVYDEMHQGKGNNTSFERFFQAQVLWDETMAEQIAQTLRQRPNSLMVVLVGQGHLVGGYGIPDRVARRFPSRPSFRQISILLNPDPELRQQQDVADYFWFSQ